MTAKPRAGIGAVLRWTVTALVLAALFVLLSDEIAALRPVTAFMDQFGFQAGRFRISLYSVLQLLVTGLVLYGGVRLLNRITRRYIRRVDGIDATQRLLAEKLVGIALVVVAFFIGVDLLGIDLTALAVFSGALGLAVGFGLQKTFGNLIAGIILLMDRSIKPGDVIVVGDSFGWVNKIGIRAVSVITRDGKEHLIPNENLMTQEVENWSFSNRDVRIHIPVRVSFDSDQKRAQALMQQAAQETARVLEEPAIAVWLMAFGENGLEYEIRAWISDPESGVNNVKSDVLNRVWELFAENGIRVPYPQRDLRFPAGLPQLAQAPVADGN
ncbi:mechanosensitive ion channel family protein [Sphingomonas sp. C3-2]|uniref:mechanosensitive ion channel family protein n=1 Tax=Sphingomonas sp. C3-2 TaxID=3062169 RepID=UPI00294AD8B4|nr:mechanosensitive ion channel domain-containing protein [Sphingomonas sp. C3-2]WOK35799.1 mechanosensitive ion channel [Sphingomonas sp. C3-2]